MAKVGDGLILAPVVLAWAIISSAAWAEKEKKPQPSKEALKELDLALRLLNAGRLDDGIDKLNALIASYPNDPVADKAKELLPDFGAGKEVRVILDERKVFRDKLKMPDKDILKLAEDALKELREKYKAVTPFFTKSSLKMHFYDSQARYRKLGGLVTAGGHLEITKAEYKNKLLEGDIKWYLPPYAKTLKDRSLSMKSTVYHETAHYLNAIHFAVVLPVVLEEGIASYFESRLNTEYYQYYRQTDRDHIEANARNGLNAITKFQEFASMLEGERGFGRGDESISRWYGFCYAIVDFFEQGEINGRKGSFDKLFKLLEEVSHARGALAALNTGLPSRLEGRPIVEMLVANFYKVDLETFHKSLVRYILSKYKQQ